MAEQSDPDLNRQFRRRWRDDRPKRRPSRTAIDAAIALFAPSRHRRSLTEKQGDDRPDQQPPGTGNPSK